MIKEIYTHARAVKVHGEMRNADQSLQYFTFKMDVSFTQATNLYRTIIISHQHHKLISVHKIALVYIDSIMRTTILGNLFW